MIKDNALSDRLNDVKNGKQIQQINTKQETTIIQKNIIEPTQQYSLKTILINKAISLFDVFMASLLYGFAIKTIFNLNWSLIGFFSVGFLLNHAISIFPRILFPKYYK